MCYANMNQQLHYYNDNCSIDLFLIQKSYIIIKNLVPSEKVFVTISLAKICSTYQC